MTLLVGSIFHMTRKIVSEMTYNVSMGTLNHTILYQYKVDKPFFKLLPLTGLEVIIGAYTKYIFIN